jgi:hypothetical protein
VKLSHRQTNSDSKRNECVMEQEKFGRNLLVMKNEEKKRKQKDSIAKRTQTAKQMCVMEQEKFGRYLLVMK